MLRLKEKITRTLLHALAVLMTTAFIAMLLRSQRRSSVAVSGCSWLDCQVESASVSPSGRQDDTSPPKNPLFDRVDLNKGVVHELQQEHWVLSLSQPVELIFQMTRVSPSRRSFELAAGLGAPVSAVSPSPA